MFRSTLQLRQEDIEEISNETGFTQPQIERLYHRLATDLYHQFVTILTFYIVIRFTSLDKSNQGFLTREDFLRFIVLTRSGVLTIIDHFRIPELAINPLGDRIVHAFFYESKKGEEEKVDFKVQPMTFSINFELQCNTIF